MLFRGGGGGHDFGAIKLFISVYEQIMVEMVMENVVNVYLLMIIMLFGKWMASMAGPGLIKTNRDLICFSHHHFRMGKSL